MATAWGNLRNTKQGWDDNSSSSAPKSGGPNLERELTDPYGRKASAKVTVTVTKRQAE